MSNPVAYIDLAALLHNFNRVKELAPNSLVMSVIKANAYGHGAVEAAHALVESDAFAVARLDEALELRMSGIKQPIVILEGIHSSEELQLASDNDLSLVFHQMSQLELIRNRTLASPLKCCWLMLETGMHRLGLSKDEACSALKIISESSAVSGPIGVMSHFSSADERGNSHNQQQLDLIGMFANENKLEMSMANSAALLSLPNSHADWVRPGLMLYGISPFEELSAAELGLKPVMKLCSKIIATQTLKKGDQVGYSGTWLADKATLVGIVDIGYADGYSRQLSNSGSVLIKDQVCAVLGRVSMDMIAVDLTDIKTVSIGDEVVLWGDKQLPVERIAAQANTIGYELVSQVNPRVKRDYHHG
ncbi:alanine racemase [Pseudomonadota bacterium]|nr:alanine racemase [Pseudomonadota bacterium]